MFQKAPQNMQTDRKELEEKARESIAESKTSQNSINEKIESMEDIYDALNNFPLLNIHPVDIPIKVPHLSRGQILAFAGRSSCVERRCQKEIERAKKNWANCPEGKTPSECSAWNAVRNKILVNADHLLSTVDQNLNTLENFLNQPFDIADIDAMVAQWINELLCFLDLTVLDLTEWFEKIVVDWKIGFSFITCSKKLLNRGKRSKMFFSITSDIVISVKPIVEKMW